MTERDIRAYLRGAVVADILEGWYQYGEEESLRFVLSLAMFKITLTYTLEQAVRYCGMMAYYGVKPLYRN